MTKHVIKTEDLIHDKVNDHSEQFRSVVEAAQYVLGNARKISDGGSGIRIFLQINGVRVAPFDLFYLAQGRLAYFTGNRALGIEPTEGTFTPDGNFLSAYGLSFRFPHDENLHDGSGLAFARLVR